ncbi:uncharacterized protein LOC119323712 [Triticum dicoccoides]|uniref:uncharacterized protein LOC119323712 n=1 Tax=Triticum dicoccoides TaxID=85692 RepID=UPI0018913723|nr:uncharacterized protein LOC119323712 [Triticum dicoccoides]
MERAWDKGVGQGDGDRHGEPEEGVARGAAHEEACPHPSSARSRLRQALMFTPLELSLLAGDLAITSLSAGMDIWIEWYPPEIYTGVRFKKEEIGPRILDRRTKR